MEHIVIWEKQYGKIPAGMQLHHNDEDKANNSIDNLVLLTPLEHKRLHSGCYKNESGEWVRPCSRCSQHKLLTVDYYRQTTYFMSTCKPCISERAKLKVILSKVTVIISQSLPAFHFNAASILTT